MTDLPGSPPQQPPHSPSGGEPPSVPTPAWGTPTEPGQTNAARVLLFPILVGLGLLAIDAAAVVHHAWGVHVDAGAAGAAAMLIIGAALLLTGLRRRQ
jgi:hypothetical protein